MIGTLGTDLGSIGQDGQRRAPGPADWSQWLRRFPPRPVPSSWEATGLSRSDVRARLIIPPFVRGAPREHWPARSGLDAVLGWLEDQPGATWQARWAASGAEQHSDWRQLPGRTVASGSVAAHRLGTGLRLLICGDVIRPGLAWLLTTTTPARLAAAMARTRDPGAFAALDSRCAESNLGSATRYCALARIATIMAAKGGIVADITVGDCIQAAQRAIELFRIRGKDAQLTSTVFYQLLHSLGVFPDQAPPTARAFALTSQLSIEAMIDRVGIECWPIRNLLVDYLREFQLSTDYSTLQHMADALGRLFWRDSSCTTPASAPSTCLPMSPPDGSNASRSRRSEPRAQTVRSSRPRPRGSAPSRT